MLLNAVKKKKKLYIYSFGACDGKNVCNFKEFVFALQVCLVRGSSFSVWGANFLGRPGHLPGSGRGRFQRRPFAMALKTESQRTGVAMVARYCSVLLSVLHLVPGEGEPTESVKTSLKNQTVCV